MEKKFRPTNFAFPTILILLLGFFITCDFEDNNLESLMNANPDTDSPRFSADGICQLSNFGGDYIKGILPPTVNVLSENDYENYQSTIQKIKTMGQSLLKDDDDETRLAFNEVMNNFGEVSKNAVSGAAPALAGLDAQGGRHSLPDPCRRLRAGLRHVALNPAGGDHGRCVFNDISVRS